MFTVELILNDNVLKSCRTAQPYDVADLWQVQMFQQAMDMDASSNEGYDFELLIDGVRTSGLKRTAN